MSEDLKPCPFCGGKAAVTGDPGKYAIVKCIGYCDAHSGFYDSPAYAIDSWNRRYDKRKLVGIIYCIKMPYGGVVFEERFATRETRDMRLKDLYAHYSRDAIRLSTVRRYKVKR